LQTAIRSAVGSRGHGSCPRMSAVFPRHNSSWAAGQEEEAGGWLVPPDVYRLTTAWPSAGCRRLPGGPGDDPRGVENLLAPGRRTGEARSCRLWHPAGVPQSVMRSPDSATPSGSNWFARSFPGSATPGYRIFDASGVAPQW